MIRKKKPVKPSVWKIQKEKDELGGRVWVMSATDFDKLFAGINCWQYKDKIWGILEIGTGENVKVYRGNGD